MHPSASVSIQIGTENEVNARNHLFRCINKLRQVRSRPPQHDFRLANVEKMVSDLLENHEIAAQEKFQWSQDAMHFRGATRLRRSVAWPRKGLSAAACSHTARVLLLRGGKTRNRKGDAKAAG